MKLSKTSALAALAMAFLARQARGELLQARTVAQHLGIPTDSALKILQTLSRRGLLQSQLGRSGGYFLNSAPQSVTLLQIIEAIDGPVEVSFPVRSHSPAVGHGVDILQRVCREMAQRIRAELECITLEHLSRSELAATMRRVS